VNFFEVYDIDIHELNLEPFKDLKFLDEISLKKCVFFVLLKNKFIVILFLRRKPLQYQRGNFFIDGHSIIFSIFFCLVKPQT